MNMNRLGWSLFEFGGETLMMNAGVLLVPWLCQDLGVTGTQYNSAMAASAVLLLLSGSRVGQHFDRAKRPSTYLVILTIAVVGCLLALYFGIATQKAPPARASFALILYFFVNYFYRLAFALYNALLRYVAKTKDAFQVSGEATAASWVGDLFGYGAVFAVLPYFGGFGGSDGARAIVPTILVYAVTTGISLILLSRIRVIPSARSRQRSLRTSIKNVPVSVRWYLFSVVFISAALYAVECNASLYLAKAMGYSSFARNILFLALVVAAALGAFVSGFITRRDGGKQTVLWCVILLVPLFIAAALVRSPVVFPAIFCAVGAVYGAIGAVLRVVYMRRVPPHAMAEHFGLYGAAQGFGFSIGPLTWLGVLQVFGEGHTGYRCAMLTMALLLFPALASLFLRFPSNEQQYHDDHDGHSLVREVHG